MREIGKIRDVTRAVMSQKTPVGEPVCFGRTPLCVGASYFVFGRDKRVLAEGSFRCSIFVLKTGVFWVSMVLLE